MRSIQGNKRGTYSRARTSYVENTEGEIRHKSHLGIRLGHNWQVRLPSVACHGKFVHKLLIVKEQE